MAKRKTPEAGGGSDIYRIQGITTPGNGRLGVNNGEVKLSLGFGPAEWNTGTEILDRIRSAVARASKQDDEKGIRELAFCVLHFPEETLRLLEFHSLMEYLVRRHRDGAVAKILGSAARGRSQKTKFYIVALVDRIREIDGVSVSVASQRAAERFGAQLGNISAPTIQNYYSAHKHDYDLFRVGRFIRSTDLTADPGGEDIGRGMPGGRK
jgi:hypothetical protein